jgi:glycosyltransferase involved in cell wall biosynthesis
MKKPETLVVITPAFPEDESATWWVPSQQLMVKALQENHPHVKIMVLALLYPYHQASYTWHDITVRAFDGTHHRKGKRLLLWKNVWAALLGIRRQYSIIGLLSFWSGECAFLGQYFGKLFSLKHISWICGQDATRGNKWVRYIRPRGHQLAAMGAFLRDQYQQSHAIRPLHLVPNAIDQRLFPPTLPTTRDIDIMAAGSFEPLKQYGLYATIVGQVSQSFPALKAIHCGLGREKEKVEALIHTLGLQDRLSLLGGRPHPEVLALMQRSKLFLHTSRYEGCSTVCLEALYAGAQVISFCYPFDHPVPNWHVVTDETAMLKKALELLQHPPASYERVLYQSMEDSAKAIMQLFTGPANTIDA